MGAILREATSADDIVFKIHDCLFHEYLIAAVRELFNGAFLRTINANRRNNKMILTKMQLI